jgi:hypothetical protein
MTRPTSVAERTLTLADHSLSKIPSPPVRRRWLLQWSGSVTSWSEPRHANRLVGARHGIVHLVLAIELQDSASAVMEGWLQWPDRRQQVFARQPVACVLRLEGHLLHLDVHLDGQRLLAMSADVTRDRLLYARSSLPTTVAARAGFFDPPALLDHDPAKGAVSGAVSSRVSLDDPLRLAQNGS